MSFIHSDICCVVCALFAVITGLYRTAIDTTTDTAHLITTHTATAGTTITRGGAGITIARCTSHTTITGIRGGDGVAGDTATEDGKSSQKFASL